MSNLLPQTEQLSHNLSEEDFHQNLIALTSSDKSNRLNSDLKKWLDTLLGSSLSIVSKRPLLGFLVQRLKNCSTDVQLATGKHAVDALRSSVASYEEQDAELRNLLADAFTGEEEYIEAAKVLQGVQLESSQRKITEGDRFNIWIRICRLYLEEDDNTTAETYLNRAKNVLYQIDDREAQLKFKLCQARISDAQRRFLEAGSVYYDISLVPMLADEERDLTLAKAITCAILAPAGPPRRILLRKLYRDERAQTLEEYTMLENMHLGRLVSPEQSDTFSGKLASHQKAQTSEGSTVLAKAIIEHNLLGISKVYESISATELGMLLGLNPEKAEKYAARMIEQDRLRAYIDYVEGFIFFQPTDRLGSSCRFDDRIRLLLEDVERIASLMSI